MCVYCVKCTKFGKLFLTKVIKTVATRCLDFSSKCPKMRLAAGRGLSAPPDPLATKREPTSKGRGRKGREGTRGRGCEGEGKAGEGRDFAGPIKIWLLRPWRICARWRCESLQHAVQMKKTGNVVTCMLRRPNCY